MPHTSTPTAVTVAAFVGRIWAAIASAGGLGTGKDYHYCAGLVEPGWARELPLPLGAQRSPTQPVALGGNEIAFHRPKGPDALSRSYEHRPRTRIYESIEAHSGGWPALAARYLMELARCHVTCTVYESVAEDATLGPHRDKWFGVIVQAEGMKEWWIGNNVLDARDAEPAVTMHPGDVLILPEGVRHDVATPQHSVHLGIAFLSHDKPGMPRSRVTCFFGGGSSFGLSRHPIRLIPWSQQNGLALSLRSSSN